LSEEERIVDLIIGFIRESGNEIFSKKPGKVADNVMKGVKQYGMAAKFYLRMYWDTIEEFFKNRDKFIEKISERDREVYEAINTHREWFNEFLDKLYESLKVFAGK